MQTQFCKRNNNNVMLKKRDLNAESHIDLNEQVHQQNFYRTLKKKKTHLLLIEVKVSSNLPFLAKKNTTVLFHYKIPSHSINIHTHTHAGKVVKVQQKLNNITSFLLHSIQQKPTAKSDVRNASHPFEFTVAVLNGNDDKEQ